MKPVAEGIGDFYKIIIPEIIEYPNIYNTDQLNKILKEYNKK